ncbi:MAG: hypothetical protein WC346_03080 [Methanogenium sp.]|jgi:hypothetical protein
MSSRVYLPTLAELIDRLSIVILKEVFVPENAKAYKEEQELIMHDIDEVIKEKDFDDTFHNILNAKIIRAILIIMLSNRYIWENESKARAGGEDQDKLLKLTHSINGVRNTAKNVIAKELGERVDLKVDCLAEGLVKEFGNWNVF